MTMKLTKTPAQIFAVFIYLICLGILLGLGGWQLLRGLEKKSVDQLLQSNMNKSIVLTARAMPWSELNYSSVQLQGTWLVEQSFLLDNRIYQGRAGYEVLTPFLLAEDSAVILVNRGWVEKTAETLNTVSTQDSTPDHSVEGQVYFPGKGFTLGPAYTDTGSWPIVIQYIDHQQLESALKMQLEPIVVVMRDYEHDSFVKIWRPYIVDASRHYGYALQWWGLAVVLLVFGYIWWFKNNSEY